VTESAPRIVWCLGLYASASTWAFNVLREMAAGQTAVQTHFLSTSFTPPSLAAPNTTHLIKTHEVENPAALAWLNRHATHILVTLRDPRDAIASLMQYHGYDFPRALDYVHKALRLCTQFAQDPRAKTLHYETKFFDNPKTLTTLNDFLALQTPPDALANIFANSRRDRIDAYIAALPTKPGVLQERTTGDLLDPETHWHTHHAGRTGEPGRWKTLLTQAQIQSAEQRLSDVVTFR